MVKTKKAAGSNIGTKKRKRTDTNLDDAPVDKSHLFDAPFPIYNDVEGKIYKNMHSLPFTAPRAFDWDLMKSLGIEANLRKYLNKLGFEKYSNMKLPGYDKLCLEFYASMELSKDSKSFTCRFLGKTYTVTDTILEEIFGFPVKGVRKVLPGFDVRADWKGLSGFDNWNSSGTSSGFIRDPALAMLHKFISYNVFGNNQANKVNTTEVYLLTCAKKGTKVSPTPFILDHMHHIKNRTKSHPTLCSIITGIAAHFGIVSLDGPPPPDNELICCKSINFSELRAALFISATGKLVDFEERICVKRFLNARAARAQGEGTSRDTNEDVDDEDDQVIASESGDFTHEMVLLRQSVQSFRDHFDASVGKLREDILARFDKQDQEIAALRAQISASNSPHGGPPPIQPPDQQ